LGKVTSREGSNPPYLEVRQNVASSTNYTLTYLAGANGAISGTSPQTVSEGGSGSAVRAVPDSGYHLVDWSDSSTANPRTDTHVYGDLTVTANFAEDTAVVSLARYDFNGGSMSSIDTDANSTASPITPTIKQDATIATNSAALGTGNNLVTDGDPIMEFSVTAAADHKLNLTSLTYDWLARASSAETHTTRVFSSLDGYVSEIASASLSPSTENDPKMATMVVDLSGAQFQGVSNVTFKVYHDISSSAQRDYGAILSSKSHGDFLGLEGLSAGTYQDVVLQGESVASLSPYDSWAATNSLTGADAAMDADPDGDGLNNLGEYALGGNPTNAAETGYSPDCQVLEISSSNYFEYVYAKRNDASERGLTYSLETSTNLVSNVWTNGSSTVVGTGPLDAEFDTVTNHVLVSDDEMFIRLNIQQ
jgi:hypothetical protein